MTVTPGPIPRSHYDLGTRCLRRGMTPTAVERELMVKGLDEPQARQVVAAKVAAFARHPELRTKDPEAARADMLVGGLICGLGLAITFATQRAAVANGGTYVLAWGPIVFGGIRFFRGLSKL